MARCHGGGYSEIRTASDPYVFNRELLAPMDEHGLQTLSVQRLYLGIGKESGVRPRMQFNGSRTASRKRTTKAKRVITTSYSLRKCKCSALILGFLSSPSGKQGAMLLPNCR